MTIHLFEGFFGPSYQALTPTLFPAATSYFTGNENGLTYSYTNYYSNSNYNLNAITGCREKVPANNKLVFGLRLAELKQVYHTISMMLCEAETPSRNFASSTPTDNGLRSPLPCFVMRTTAGNGLTTVGLRTPNTSISSHTAIPTQLATWNLEGLDTQVNEYCIEVEYDFLNNMITVWFDGFKKITYPYTFTDAQKAIREFYPVLENRSYHAAGNNSSGPSTVTYKHIHFSDEVLGNVRAKQLKPTSDYQVDPVFNAPAFSKFDTYNAGVTSTKSGKMLLEVSDITDESILAMNTIATFSKSQVSAYETVSTEKLVISNGTSESTGPTKDVQNSSYDFRIMQNNPLTGGQWTKDDVNQIKVGVDLVVRDRFPRTT